MKTFFVIGASSGIGLELARLLQQTGHRVIGTHFENLPSPEIESHYLNVLDEDWTLDFLPEKLDGLAYCPGNINLKPFHRIKPEAFVEDFRLQALGAVRAIQECLPALKEGGKASVVLFSTVAVQTGYPFHSQVATSKGAIEGLARALAAELAPAVRVNAVAPSLTDTPLAARLLSTDEKKAANAQRHPLKKIGKAADLAEMAAFLLTDKSSWMTGQILHVDGGMSSLRV